MPEAESRTVQPGLQGAARGQGPVLLYWRQGKRHGGGTKRGTRRHPRAHWLRRRRAAAASRQGPWRFAHRCKPCRSGLTHSAGGGETRMTSRLLALIDRFPRTRVVVVGDLVADEFIYGRLSRVSREAPVLILEYDTTEIVPGGAGNAASNVAALGGKVTLVGAAGRDQAGDRLIAALKERAVRLDVARPRDMATPVKTRILAGGVHSVKQQIVRIDRQGGGASKPA